jgi:hypothetical protein
MRLKEYNPLNGTVVLYPFAVVADVALSPFYLLAIIALEINWHT